MARNVFFSFDYDDILAVNVVRNSDVILPANRNLPFRDRSLYEEARKTSGAIKNAIDDAVDGTSVTAVLVGEHTWRSAWVRYEIAKSLERGNGFVVIDIDGIGPSPTPNAGANPLDAMMIAPWHGADGFQILEWDGRQFSEFAALPSVKNATAKYPSSILSGNAFQMSAKFHYRAHWRIAKPHMLSTLEQAASEVGWPANP